MEKFELLNSIIFGHHSQIIESNNPFKHYMRSLYGHSGNLTAQILIICLIALQSDSYSRQINMDTSAGVTLTNFYADLAICSCDLTDGCDNFCCCDSSCAAQTVTTWTDNNWCRNTETDIQNLCEELSKKGYSSFQDLGCVMYSNRGLIGYYYDLPDLDTATYPSPRNFGYRYSTANVIDPSAITTPTNPTLTVTGQESGNPGYIFGRNLLFESGSIKAISDNNLCIAATATQNQDISIKFGINTTFVCSLTSTTSPCDQQLYIDSLALNKDAIRLRRYGLSSNTQSVEVNGVQSNTCSKQVITINILYSFSGWVLDPQYYILGSTVSTLGSADSEPPTRKYLQVKWMFVDPQTVENPPTNYFYSYFNYLWLPLRDKFTNYLWESQAAKAWIGIVAMMIYLDV